MTIQTKRLLLEYSKDLSVYSSLNLTFGELFLHVFYRIEINPHRNEIKRILNKEMQESVGKCLTGRISRLVNCLNGFDDLVNVKMADNEQIAQKIEVVKKRLEKEKNYSTKEHKDTVKKELIELGFDSDVIEVWTSAIE